MIYDTHVHSEISADSDAPPMELIAAAEKKGYGITFAEHYDPDDYNIANGFCIDPDGYTASYAKYRQEGALIGIEIGLAEESRIQSEAMSRQYPFDFVLGAVHIVSGADIYADFMIKKKLSFEPADYLHAVRRMTEHAFYDSLAHIDYPHRYAAAYNSDFSYDTHAYQYNQILRNLVEQDVCIEINTRRLNDKEAIADLMKIYGGYAALGGKYVTIGSDAHTASDIGINFAKAFEIADACCLTPVYYTERKRRAY